MTSWLGQEQRECPPADTEAGGPARFFAQAPALVLAFGNVLLSDDGAGIQLLGRVRSELGDAAAHFVDAGTLSFSLLTYLEEANSLLVFDAADLGAMAGAVRLFEAAAMDQFLSSSRRRTPQHWPTGVADARERWRSPRGTVVATGPPDQS